MEDEREFANNCLITTPIVQEIMGDKPVIEFNAIKYLDSKAESQLSFSRIN